MGAGPDLTLISPTTLERIAGNRSRLWSVRELCGFLVNAGEFQAGGEDAEAAVDHALRRLVASGRAKQVRPGVYRFG